MKKKHSFLKIAVNNIHSENLSKNIKSSAKNKIIKSENNSVDITPKINYKFYNNYFKIQRGLSSLEENNNNSQEELYWFAAYDKLIKTKKIFKIFSFYNIASKNSIALNNKSLYYEFDKIKEKKMKIKNYEIIFLKNMNTKPFLIYSEGKIIHTKLYLLNLKQINMIFSYINRIEYNNYLTSLNNITEKNKFFNIFNEDGFNIIYPSIYCLGSFMNIGMYTFSRAINESENNFLNNKINSNIKLDLIPNSKKVAKLIKLLLINYPEYSKEYFINYIFSYFQHVPNTSEINNNILTEKKNEINHLLISQKKSLYKIKVVNKDSTGIRIDQNSQEISSSPFLSSFNNNINNISNSNKINSNLNNNISNTNNNMINNINNNLGTISYNASYFDFTSDNIISIKQNKENLSKVLDSIRSLSNQNRNILSVSNNNNKRRNNKYNNNIIKQQSSNNDKKNNSQISNFYFENESKNNKNILKINVNKKINILRKGKKVKNLYLKKDIMKYINNYPIIYVPSFLSEKNNSIKLRQKNTFTSTIKNSKYSLDNIPNNYTHNFTEIKTENKENYNSNSISNCGDIYMNNSRKNNEIIKRQKILNFNCNTNKTTYLKGEDIFLNTDNYRKKNNSAFMYILDKNGVNSFDSKNIRRNKVFRLSKC